MKNITKDILKYLREEEELDEKKKKEAEEEEEKSSEEKEGDEEEKGDESEDSEEKEDSEEEGGEKEEKNEIADMKHKDLMDLMAAYKASVEKDEAYACSNPDLEAAGYVSGGKLSESGKAIAAAAKKDWAKLIPTIYAS